LSAIVSRGSSTHAHNSNEEDMLSLVKAQLLRQQLLMEEEQLLFKHEAKNIYNIECSPKIFSIIAVDWHRFVILTFDADPESTFHLV
jgi:hypothetical protein